MIKYAILSLLSATLAIADSNDWYILMPPTVTLPQHRGDFTFVGQETNIVLTWDMPTNCLQCQLSYTDDLNKSFEILDICEPPMSVDIRSNETMFFKVCCLTTNL